MIMYFIFMNLARAGSDSSFHSLSQRERVRVRAL
jgi:hypothetical protein